jgi:hypothetical protein
MVGGLRIIEINAMCILSISQRSNKGMIMIKLSELDEWLNDLRDLILDVNICLTNARRIANDKYENEKKLKKAGFFYHYQLQQVFIISIQLCKILTDSGNQKRNVHKLFKTIETQEFDDELKNRLKNDDKYLAKSRDELIDEINRLKGLIGEQTNLIERVKVVRDKAYAHYDPDRVKFGLSLVEYQVLVDLSAEIYNGLHLKLFGSTMLFKHTIPWEIDSVIRMAAKQFTDLIGKRQAK